MAVQNAENGVVKGGHSRSWAMPLFDRAHTTSYSILTETMCLSFRGDLWHQKTRVPRLSCSVVCVIMCLAVLVELRLVTETQTRTQTYGHRAMASTADA